MARDGRGEAMEVSHRLRVVVKQPESLEIWFVRQFLILAAVFDLGYGVRGW
jgi:hypothetical protein